MEALLDEIESLEAILMDDVKIIRNAETGSPELIETVVLPTVGEDTDRQYVCVTLQVMFSDGYPDTRPTYYLRNPRGLDDQMIATIRLAIETKLTESIGCPVVFDLIDVIREHLTDSNLPTGQCVVCLYGFQNGDAFTKTECYHYLHSFCLARHLKASHRNYQEEQDKLPAWQRKTANPYRAFCPVCREPINDDDVDALANALPPSELENAPAFELTSELKGLQVHMANLFMHQKQRGGIIDLKADESNVISIEDEESRAEQATKSSSGQLANSFGPKSQADNKQISTASSNVATNSRSTDKCKEEAKRAAASKVAAAANAADDEEDNDRRDRNHGRRGNKHRRNGYHHHRHHHGRHSSSAATTVAAAAADASTASRSDKR